MNAQPTLLSTSVARRTNLSPHFAILQPLWRTTRVAAEQVARRAQKMSWSPNPRRACTTGWWLGVGQSETQRVEWKGDVVLTSGDLMVETNPARRHQTE